MKQESAAALAERKQRARVAHFPPGLQEAPSSKVHISTYKRSCLQERRRRRKPKDFEVLSEIFCSTFASNSSRGARGGLLSPSNEREEGAEAEAGNVGLPRSQSRLARFPFSEVGLRYSPISSGATSNNRFPRCFLEPFFDSLSKEWI